MCLTRSPDAQLNADLPAHLAALAKSLKFTLIYISTGMYDRIGGCLILTNILAHADYVFDGTAPPYTPASPTNPINLYGLTKRDGEVAVLSVTGANVVSLRIPVL